MKTISYKDKEGIKEIIERQAIDLVDVMAAVSEIIADVREHGDAAVFKYTDRFDGFTLDRKNIRVSREEIKKAYKKVDKGLVEALLHAHENIKRFHCRQGEKSGGEWKMEVQKGVVIGEKTSPLEAVGCYVPGGRATYPSTVLMTATPAKIAGVRRIAIVSPPPISDAILVAADICGVDEIYRAGGAQAIAALAYGTESIAKVDKIVGPGNKYVMAAKMQSYGAVDIDMPAGPSEVLILADKDSNPGYIAADVLAQAEHDIHAQSLVATDSMELIEEIEKEIEAQLRDLPARETAKKSLLHGSYILTDNREETIEFANEYAAEHLEIMLSEPEKALGDIRNAGAIFLGDYAPVAAGDYASGANHVLPTSGTARFSSELSVRDFLKTSSVQRINREGLSLLADTISEIASAEGFTAHKKSVEKRLEVEE